MIEKDDWRLTAGPVCGCEDKLKNIPLWYIPFQPLSEKGDHEHCAFCWARFSSYEGDLQTGYCTRPQNTAGADWICPACFEDFKEMFGWTLQGERSVKYFLNAAQRKDSRSTCYFEFQRGSHREKHWLQDSLYLHADQFDALRLYELCAEAVEGFNYYGPTAVHPVQWAHMIRLSADNDPWQEIIAELTPWVESCFGKYKCFTICGI